MRRCEDRYREHRRHDRDHPAQDPEQETDERQRRQDIGQHDAANHHQAQQRRYEPVADLPGAFEDIRALAHKRHAFHETGDRRGRRQRTYRPHSRDNQPVTHRREVRHRIPAVRDDHVVEIDPLHQATGRPPASNRRVRHRRRLTSRPHRRVVLLRIGQRPHHRLRRRRRRRRPLLDLRSRQRYLRSVARSRLEAPDPVRDRVEKARRRQPVRRPRILRDNLPGLVALLLQRRRQAAPHGFLEPLRHPSSNQKRLDVRKFLSVLRRSGHEPIGQRGRILVDFVPQRLERILVTLRHRSPRAVRRRPAEPHRPAKVLRRPLPLPREKPDRRSLGNALRPDHRRTRFLARDPLRLVRRRPAHLRHQQPPDRRSDRRRRRLHLSRAPQDLCRERPPHRRREITAQVRQADDDVLRSVHAARQRRHQRHRNHDAHDLPAAEPPASLARRVHRAGDGVPDKQEPREDQQAPVEDEKHLAQRRVRLHVEVAEESQQCAGRLVRLPEQSRLDRLPRRRPRRDQAHDPHGGRGHAPRKQSRAERNLPAAPAPSDRSRRRPPEGRKGREYPRGPARVPERPRQRRREIRREERTERTHGFSRSRRPG